MTTVGAYKYYNSLIKPSMHRQNKSVSDLKPLVYKKTIDPEVVNALYLKPRFTNADLSSRNEQQSRKDYGAENMKFVE